MPEPRELDPILQQTMFAPTDTPPPHFADMDPTSARAFTKQMVAMMESDIAPQGSTQNRAFKGPDGDIRLRVYRPDASASVLPGIVYFHGGGWVVGDLDTHDNTCRLLADRVNARVVAVDYRLAPEHRFPAAPEDCYAALLWVHQNAAELGINPSRIAVAGDSAGGNLAAAVAIMARDRNGPKLAAQILAYPALEYMSQTASMDEMATGYGLEKRDMHWFYGHYVPAGTERSDPRLSPLLVPDLTGLAPVVITVAGFDPLHDEGAAYARRLADAGGAVKFFDRTSLVHGFLSLVAITPAANAAFDEIAAAARALLAKD